MSNEEINHKIEEEVNKRLKNELNVKQLNRITGEIKTISDKLEEMNNINRDEHQKLKVDYIKLFGWVSEIKDRDALDFIVLSARKYPKSTLAILISVLLKDTIHSLVTALLENVIR